MGAADQAGRAGARRSIDDVDEHATAVAHRGGLHDGAQRVGRAPAAADDLAVVVVGHRQLEDDGAVVLLEVLDLDLVRLVDERAGERLQQRRAAGASAAIGG